MYLRFLDYIFGIRQHSLEEFQNFMKLVNTHPPNITTKHSINLHSIQYFDTTVYFRKKDFKTITHNTKVYVKSTDTHTLLHKASCHPKHTIKVIIKSQIYFYRLCTNIKGLWESDKHFSWSLETQSTVRDFYGKSNRRQLHNLKMKWKTSGSQIINKSFNYYY